VLDLSGRDQPPFSPHLWLDGRWVRWAHRLTGGVVKYRGAALDGWTVVAWRQHDRISVDQVLGAAVDSAVQQVPNPWRWPTCS
jgi:hypothetical protein